MEGKLGHTQLNKVSLGLEVYPGGQGGGGSVCVCVSVCVICAPNRCGVVLALPYLRII